MCVIDGMSFFGMEPGNIAALPRPKEEHTRTAQPICARAGRCRAVGISAGCGERFREANYEGDLS